jgi:hypothetical protein
LAAAIAQAFQQELDLRRSELQAQLQQRINGEVARLDQVLAGKQEQLLARLQGQIGEARQLSQSLAKRLPVASPAMPAGLSGSLPIRF